MTLEAVFRSVSQVMLLVYYNTEILKHINKNCQTDLVKPVRKLF